MEWAKIILAVVHAVAGAAWFGAMIYSLTVLSPKAWQFFRSESDFDEFVAFVAHGARTKVFFGMTIVAFSGLCLTVLNWSEKSSIEWIVLVILKLSLFLGAVGIFLHTTFFLWPRRILASRQEAPLYRTKFKRIGMAMIMLVGANLVLGVVAHFF